MLDFVHLEFSWCGPCKMIAPLFEDLSEEYSDSNVIFVKIDVDTNVESAAKYGVSAMPTFVFLKDGEVVDRLMGANPTKLQEMIEELK
jgi:thioredoxin 1